MQSNKVEVIEQQFDYYLSSETNVQKKKSESPYLEDILQEVDFEKRVVNSLNPVIVEFFTE